MQPTLAIVAPAPGMIALNGRFAGEASPDEPLLAAVPEDSRWYPRALRMMRFLNYFKTADVEDEIPPTSILREFIGGCTFYLP